MGRLSIKLENRGSLTFLGGLGIATAFALYAENGLKYIGARDLIAPFQAAELTPAPMRAVQVADMEAARVAWRYFELHYRPETGLVDSVAGFPSTTLWDQGSYLLALVSARRIGLVSEGTFQSRIAALLGTLEALPLFEGKLPNKVYHTQTLQMVTYENAPSEEGIGWSALDVARMLMALRVLEITAPETGPRLRALLAGWDLNAMASQGRLFGSTREHGETLYLQEGRIGYEQYGARAAALWGLDVLDASSARTILGWEKVGSVRVPVDVRHARSFGAITPTLSEPYLLQAFELGLNAEAALFASRIYRAQEGRFHESGVLTMVSEDNLDQAPHFAYASVFSNGAPWAVVTEQGQRFDSLRTVSLKATFGWDALFRTEYTQQSKAYLSDLARENGWAAGKYEEDGRPNEIVTLNTNAVVLEAIHYMSHGPLASY